MPWAIHPCRAAADMSQLTWERTTSKLAKLLLGQAD
jgi:hypothetical protein